MGPKELNFFDSGQILPMQLLFKWGEGSLIYLLKILMSISLKGFVVLKYKEKIILYLYVSKF